VVIKAIDAGWIFKQPQGQEFIKELSNSEKMEYFNLDTVKYLVKYQWRQFKPLLIKFLFIPFLIYLILYNLYAIWLFEARVSAEEEGTMVDIATFTIEIFLMILTVHAAYIEYQQMMYHGRYYFTSFWNMIDLACIVVTPAILIQDWVRVDPHFIRPVIAVGLMIMYMKLFYFLRMFDQSAALVRTIVEITYDIRFFLCVLFIAVMGFASSLLVLARNNDTEKDTFLKSFPEALSYSYRIALGDFETGEFGDRDVWLVWIFFTLATLLMLIILLNMLIAIMSDSFQRVQSQQESQRVREHLQLIVENDFLIDREEVFGRVKYLIAIQEELDEENVDPLKVEIQAMGREHSGQYKHLRKEMDYINDRMGKIQTTMLEMKSEMMKALTDMDARSETLRMSNSLLDASIGSF